jgi:tRNA (cytidine/uridine-2'-O-)-methyltransferase
MRIALYQPEIPGNVGAILRLGACFDTPVDIIEPCGFIWSDSRVKRAGMDYINHVTLCRHMDWQAFQATKKGRMILLSTKASIPLTQFQFKASDTLLFGQESSGVPETVRGWCDHAVRIPLANGIRSLNVAVSAGVALHEALRQTGGLAG